MRPLILSLSERSHTLLHTHADGSSTVQQVSDVSDAVERAKTLHREGFHQTGMGDKHVASIPIPALTEWAQKRGKTFSDVMQDDSLMKVFLEDPDNSFFLIWKGAL
jgi:hypothetical protein